MTKAQQRTYEAFMRFYFKEGRSPTIREVAKASGLSSYSTVFVHMNSLVGLGLLEHRPGTMPAYAPVFRAEAVRTMLARILDYCEQHPDNPVAQHIKSMVRSRQAVAQ